MNKKYVVLHSLCKVTTFLEHIQIILDPKKSSPAEIARLDLIFPLIKR